MSMRNLGYGPCLSDEEYDHKIVELHSALPPIPSRDEDRIIRRKELNLAIDHRLGVDFPEPKREKLWHIAEEVDNKRIRMSSKYLLRSLFSKSRADSQILKNADWLTKFMIDAYSKVLNDRELQSFFGLNEINNIQG